MSPAFFLRQTKQFAFRILQLPICNLAPLTDSKRLDCKVQIGKCKLQSVPDFPARWAQPTLP
jgi:hypothetical protein